jgi:hypothetical protein
LPAARRTPESQSDVSAAKLCPQDLLGSLREVRLSLEGPDEQQVPSPAVMLIDSTADQLQRWPKLSLRKLVHQMVEFVTQHAHGLKRTDGGMPSRELPQDVMVAGRRLGVA